MFLNLDQGRPLDDSVVKILAWIEQEIMNVHNAGGNAGTRRTNYLVWAHQASDRLRGVVTSEELAKLVLTQRYHSLLSAALPDREMNGLLDLEIGDRIAKWRQLGEQTRSWRTRWSEATVVVVPDTNVFVHHELLFDAVPWAKIANQPPFSTVAVVVPLLVVDELDRLKRTGKAEVQKRARETLKRLNELFRSGPGRVVLQPDPVVVTVEVLIDGLDHQRLSDNDSELIARTRLLADLVQSPVLVVTADTGMSLRARAVGLHVNQLDL